MAFHRQAIGYAISVLAHYKRTFPHSKVAASIPLYVEQREANCLFQVDQTVRQFYQFSNFRHCNHSS